MKIKLHPRETHSNRVHERMAKKKLELRSPCSPWCRPWWGSCAPPAHGGTRGCWDPPEACGGDAHWSRRVPDAVHLWGNCAGAVPWVLAGPWGEKFNRRRSPPRTFLVFSLISPIKLWWVTGIQEDSIHYINILHNHSLVEK